MTLAFSREIRGVGGDDDGGAPAVPRGVGEGQLSSSLLSNPKSIGAVLFSLGEPVTMLTNDVMYEAMFVCVSIDHWTKLNYEQCLPDLVTRRWYNAERFRQSRIYTMR